MAQSISPKPGDGLRVHADALRSGKLTMAEHTYSVKLVRVDPDYTINAIKAVRSITRMGLAEAKGIVDYVRSTSPVEIAEGLPYETAARHVELLLDASCIANVVGGDAPLSHADQDSLLRVVRAARAVVNSSHSPRCVEERAHVIVYAGQGSTLPCICGYSDVYHTLYAAVNGGLPESIRARLSEGE